MYEFEIRDTPGKGKGLFVSQDFEPNQVIIRFDGKSLVKSDIPDFSGSVASNLLQIGTELYLDLGNHHSYFINHSCRPNCCVRVAVNNAFLIALRPIPKGTELFFDYATTSTESFDTWKLDCSCDNFYCRKEISGFGYVPKVQQDQYLKQNAVPDYVLKNFALK